MDKPPLPLASAVERLRKALAELPATVRLARTSERALDDLADEDVARILEDIARVATHQFPGEVKPIKTLPGQPLQADTGRFRFLFRWQRGLLEVIAIFPKSAQQRIFRGMR